MKTIKDPLIQCRADEDGSGPYEVRGFTVIAHSMSRAEEVLSEHLDNVASAEIVGEEPSAQELFQ